MSLNDIIIARQQIIEWEVGKDQFPFKMKALRFILDRLSTEWIRQPNISFIEISLRQSSKIFNDAHG